MKNIKPFLLTIFLSLMHVHCSAYTVENVLNPLFWVILGGPQLTHGLYANQIEIAGGIIIQGWITYLIASTILNWKNRLAWTGSLIIGLTLGLVLWPIEDQIDIIVEESPSLYVLNEIYEGIYLYGGSFDYVTFCCFIQLLMIGLYPLFIKIIEYCKNKRSNYADTTGF